MRELWRYWLEAFDDLTWEPEEMIAFGNSLLVSARQRGTGSGSGVAVSEPVFQVFTPEMASSCGRKTSSTARMRSEPSRDRARALVSRAPRSPGDGVYNPAGPAITNPASSPSRLNVYSPSVLAMMSRWISLVPP
jgi:hypothetical protein